MRIESVRIQNFRAFADELIDFGRYVCLVGPNGAGKSTVLSALNVFFRETRNAPTDVQALSEEDFHNRDTSKPVVITVTFTDLSDTAKEDLRHYVRHGKLTVESRAEFDPDSRRAEVRQFGARLGIEAFASFFRAIDDKESSEDLKRRYQALREKGYEALPMPRGKDAMVEALRAYEASHEEDCVLIPSGDQFYGFTKGENRLRPHVEYVFVPAIKDASDERLQSRSNALGALVARAVGSKVSFDEGLAKIREEASARYRDLVNGQRTVLSDLQTRLQEKVSQWASPHARIELNWSSGKGEPVEIQTPVVETSAGEDGFLGELARLGHGLQRSYLLALLHELASGEHEQQGPQLILACEEPELFQHPPQARHLSSILTDLSTTAQILVCTHSPLFVRSGEFEDVRVVRKPPGSKAARVTATTFESYAEAYRKATEKRIDRRAGVAALIARALQPELCEMFFGHKIILVEGVEDAAYITSYFHLSNRWTDFRRKGCHVVPVHNKSNLLQPVIIATLFELPFLAIFDCDGDEDKDENRRCHERDNKALFKALGYAEVEAFPTQTVWNERVVAWPACLSKAVQAEIGADLWKASCQVADVECGQLGGLKKHPMHIGAALRTAWEGGGRSATLEKLGDQILR